MRVVRNRPEQVAAQPVCSGRSVVAIGNFDGVHLGHQALLKRCRELMQDGDELAVVTFEPLPHAWFNPENDVARLSTTYHKLALFRESTRERCLNSMLPKDKTRLCEIAEFCHLATANLLEKAQ